jgi:hypothetical protein
MKYAVETRSCAMIYISGFIMTGSINQKFIERYRHNIMIAYAQFYFIFPKLGKYVGYFLRLLYTISTENISSR